MSDNIQINEPPPMELVESVFRPERQCWRLTMLIKTPFGGQFVEVIHAEYPVPDGFAPALVSDYVANGVLEENRPFYDTVRVEPVPRYERSDIPSSPSS